MKWAPVDKGCVDWTGQFRALKQAGFRDAVSLETHWRGGGMPEACTRATWAGMKPCLENSETSSTISRTSHSSAICCSITKRTSCERLRTPVYSNSRCSVAFTPLSLASSRWPISLLVRPSST